MIWEIDDQTEEIEGLDENGRADPAYAAALGLLPAPAGRRALAVVYDIAAWILTQLPLWLGAVPLLLKLADGSISAYGLVNHPGFVLAVVMASVTTLFTLVLVILQWSLHAVKGMTIGKALCGIRTVEVRRLGKPGFLRLLLRVLIIGLAGVLPVLGPALFLISPLFDPERRGRGWHDMAAKVWLVDIRSGLNPFDEKRLRVARKMVKAEPARERAPLPSLATPDDPSVQPAYRPGNRVSAGVLGIARPHDSNERPVVGLPQTAARAPEAPVEAGKPVLGGYRREPQGEADQSDAAVVPEAPAPLSDQPAAAVTEAARYGLRFDTGEGIAVITPVLLGRNPDADIYPGAVPVALADDTRSLSKTHLLASPAHDGIEIVDCGSTNGSELIRDGAEHALVAGAPTLAVEGDAVRLGDRIATVVRV